MMHVHASIVIKYTSLLRVNKTNLRIAYMASIKKFMVRHLLFLIFQDVVPNKTGNIESPLQGKQENYNH